MKTWGSGGIPALFFTSELDTDEWSALRPGPFNPGEKAPEYAIDRRLDGPYRWSGRCGVEKIACAWQESNTGRPARSQ
jgi:hypothetical protein